MVMFISTQVLAQSKDCLEMGILSGSSEKVNHCGINSQQIAVKIEQTSMHFITSWSDHHRVWSVPARSKEQGDQGDLFKRHLPKEHKCLKPKNMILSTQEVAPQSPEHLEMETCPNSSEEVNDAKSCNLLLARPSPYWFIISDHSRSRGGSSGGFRWAGPSEIFEIMRALWEPIWYHRISGVDDVWRLPHMG